MFKGQINISLDEKYVLVQYNSFFLCAVIALSLTLDYDG